ncbi:stage II sporulation protein M [Auraticoccus sp. F435]|uniref:Stage II sporulation protein M n=1 Tax=Auraticoccus cholistanensis TaxID=2656650 RepID=A0A6A9V199_9ACTN|nr:stage II sporulation protein M [Auraticoccus cholistanensis]MVA76730.1 stage II sporulation protein M [Auraticoccus cholistanensis]
MDIDSYVAEREEQWNRLDALTSGRRPLTGAQADELVDLCARVGTHLSVVRASGYDPLLEARLTDLLARARGVLTGTSPVLLPVLVRFLTVAFPAAVYRSRWLALGTAVVTVLLGVLVASRVAADPALADSLLPPELQRAYVEHDFAAYYSDNPAHAFGLEVWLNNARVAALCLLLGVALVPLLLVLWTNTENLGVAAGFMVGHDRADVFFGLILPHGLLELTAIWIAAAGGLRLAWAWISPGARSRGAALAQEGRAAASTALGLVPVLLVSGALESLLTPSTLPAWARVGIGATVWAAVLAYLHVLGRRAVLAGETGDLLPGDRSAEQPYEAAV